MKIILILALTGVFIYTCNSNITPKGFTVISVDTLKQIGDIRIKIIANDASESNAIKKKYLQELYSKNKNYDVVGIYLYSSKEKAAENPDFFDMMLFKTPQDSEPLFKEGLFESDKKDIVMQNGYDSLKKVLEAKGVDFCKLYGRLNDLIKQSNKEESEMTGTNYNDMDARTEKKFKKSVHKLFSKYGLPDSLSKDVQIYGEAFCK